MASSRKCTSKSCNHFVWHSPLTPIEEIPLSVRTAFAVRMSNRDMEAESGGTSGASGTSGTMCTACSSGHGGSRKANSNCDRNPKFCSRCCKEAGGCKIHKLGPCDPTSGQLQGISPSHTPSPMHNTVAADSALPTPSIRQEYARPLNEKYALAYIEQHAHHFEAQKQISEIRRLENLKSQTIDVVFWNKVHVFSPAFSTCLLTLSH